MTETKHNNAKPQPFEQYGFDGATSAREASYLKMKHAEAKQQSLIGGTKPKPKRKRNTMKKSLLRNNSNRIKRKTNRIKRKTNRIKRKTNRVKRKTNRVKRKTNRVKRKKTRGGSGGKTSGRATTVDIQTIDVPSFSVVGNSPMNANSISQSANSIMMQSDADSVYDHYADGGDIQKQSQNGGSKYANQNEWYKAFPPISDDKSNTG